MYSRVQVNLKRLPELLVLRGRQKLVNVGVIHICTELGIDCMGASQSMMQLNGALIRQYFERERIQGEHTRARLYATRCFVMHGS